MISKKRYEGYLLVDHSACHSKDIPIGLPKKLETATITCSHCPRVVIINPLRQRTRHHCFGCDKYICDSCALEKKLNGGKCKTYRQKLDEYSDKIEKHKQPIIISQK